MRTQNPFNRRWRFAGAPLALAFGVAVNLALPGSASAQLAPLYNQLMNTLQQQLVRQFMAKMGVGIEGAVTQSGAATQAEILKASTAQKAIAEGLEAYRAQQRLRVIAQETVESMQQPASTCESMAAQASLGNVTQTSRAAAVKDQSRVIKRINGNSNTQAVLEAAHQLTNSTMCTESEAARKICELSPSNRELAGADQNATVLFQGSDGSFTLDGTHDGPQSRAADSYINRVVASVPPEQLRAADYGKSPVSRAYIELTRRYAAVMSMSSYSLTQLKASHVPQVGLGTNTMMADVKIRGFASGKADMSMIEAVQRFVATKFSPAAMHDAATAVSPNLILRDMAQMKAFELWISQQTLLQDSRTEALMAHQLALLTEQTLRPQLEAQRVAATQSARR